MESCHHPLAYWRDLYAAANLDIIRRLNLKSNGILEAKIQQSKTQITVDLQERSISFSKKNLRSIVFNLVSNSLKFNQSLHPTIHISTEKSGGQLIVSVKDNGVGIATTELDHIFSLYGRVRNDIEGDGIGLYLIKRIIDASGGRLVVESIPGEGSKFSIYFAAD